MEFLNSNFKIKIVLFVIMKNWEPKANLTWNPIWSIIPIEKIRFIKCTKFVEFVVFYTVLVMNSSKKGQRCIVL